MWQTEEFLVAVEIAADHHESGVVVWGHHPYTVIF